MIPKPLSLRPLFLIVALACSMPSLAQDKNKDAPAGSIASVIDPDVIDALKEMSA